MSVMELFQSGFALALLQDLLERLRSLVVEEIGESMQFDSEQELKKLEMKLKKAQALLDGFQLTPNNEWQDWVGDITRICYDAEDLADDLAFVSTKTSILQKIFSFFTNSTMTLKIQELHNRLEDIVGGLDVLAKTRKRSKRRSKRSVKEPFDDKEKLFGRDQDKESIITMLLGEAIRGVSIVGMDGLGKTTLARNVRYDSRIQANFDLIAWVSVSGIFNRRKIARLIQNSVGQMEVLELGTILIVLDDLWDVKYTEWKHFKSSVIRNRGCKVLVTSRNPKVAKVTGATPYYLPRMKDEDCKDLIMDRATSLNHFSERELIHLMDVSEVIAEKCKGLPLAANTLGLLLSSSERSEDHWTAFSGRDIYDLEVFREEVFPVFRLGEPDLASHLKKCLAYCSLFPYNYDFKKENMVKLWMAEGFILSRGLTSLEEIGNEYFDELSGRSIFQCSHIDDDEVETYRIHEFIHRFAEFVASDTCFRLEKSIDGELSCSIPWYKKARHLSFLCDSIKLMFLKDIEKCEGLRTFLVLSEHGTKIGEVPYSLFQKIQRLRALDLSQTDVDKLPESIGRLKYLRYLDVSKTRIQRLPESTSELLGLRVLRLRECPKLLALPKNTQNLTELLHLDVDLKGLRCMPKHIGKLTHLQTLHSFIAGKKEGFRVTELRSLKNLRGSIRLSGLETVKDGFEARLAMLCDKPFINKLELEWMRHSTNAKDILDALKPHKNLRALQVVNYGGCRFPDWLTHTSCMLVSVHLQNSRHLNVLPPLGNLPFLKILDIEGMDNVENVDYNFCGESASTAFPALKLLKFRNMSSLTKWYRLPDSSLCSLRELVFEDCSELVWISSLSHMRALLKLEINRCPRLELLPDLPPSVKSLIIMESDIVTRRCQTGGPEWFFIQGIPYVEIDFIEILSSEG